MTSTKDQIRAKLRNHLSHIIPILQLLDNYLDLAEQGFSPEIGTEAWLKNCAQTLDLAKAYLGEMKDLMKDWYDAPDFQPPPGQE